MLGWSRSSAACSRAKKHALSCTLSFDLLDRSEDAMERDAHRQRQNFKERCRFDEIANLLLRGMIAPPEVVIGRVLIDQVDLCRTSPTQAFSAVDRCNVLRLLPLSLAALPAAAFRQAFVTFFPRSFKTVRLENWARTCSRPILRANLLNTEIYTICTFLRTSGVMQSLLLRSRVVMESTEGSQAVSLCKPELLHKTVQKDNFSTL